MSKQAGQLVTLRMLDKADKEILKLDRAVKGALYDFQHKFRRDPTLPGLQLKQLSGSRLYSARVTQEYRAILAPVGENEWLLLTVAHRRESYEDLEKLAKRFAYDINPVTGGIEFVDIVAVEDSIGARRAHQEPAAGPAPLFAAYTREQLTDLGIAESLLAIIAKVTSEEELLGLVEYAPTLTGEVLLALHDGKTIDEVHEQVVAPQATDEPVDPDDFVQAAARPATQVSSEDKALEAALQGDFPRWKIFLHPNQRKLVTRTYNGPARVSGGPGTGKTIVAIHRVRHLVEQLPPGDDKPVLLTTYTRNLAADMRDKLIDLAGIETANRVDVVNIDKLARRIADASESQGARTVISDQQALSEWRDLLAETGDTGWDPEFLAAEWSQVILGQALNSFGEYARARRAGRGRPLNRSERRAVWQLAERFSKRLDEQGWTTHAASAALSARLESERAARLATAESSASGNGYRYKHIVVDEAQDLHPAHWKMLRAMVAPGRDDIFCVGDTHQRIYDNVVSLGSLGIKIRGRSTKLTLNYRTTRQILGSAMQLLHGESYDDLDGGLDNLIGYRSVLHGSRPTYQGFATLDEELDAVAAQVAEWSTTPTQTSSADLAVCAPTKDLVTRVAERLKAEGLEITELTPDGPKGTGDVVVGTMHRLKGLEFRRLIITGASEGLIPRGAIDRWRDRDRTRYLHEIRRDRSLLFVAATRARDDLAIYWHGTPSRFLGSGQ